VTEGTGELGFEFQVVTPTRVVIRERVTSVVVPGARGAMGFWARHAPTLVALGPGVVKYRTVDRPDRLHLLAVGGGFFEMSPSGRATLLADTAELPDEIDVPRAEAALKRARRRLFQPTLDTDTARAEAALKRALARLEVARGR